jgi:hypothetical protein
MRAKGIYQMVFDDGWLADYPLENALAGTGM